MLKNYFKIVIRSTRRHAGYTFINVFGLAVGMACCILIFLYVRNELSVNTLFDDVDRIYRIDSEWREASMGIFLTTLAPVGETMVEVYPEVTDQVRMYLMTNTVRIGENGYRVDVMMADTTVFRLFEMPFLYGRPEEAFSLPRSVVITDRLAIKLFGTENVIGRTILFETFSRGDLPYTVTGIRKTLPFNSVTYFGAEEGEYDVIMSPYPYGDFFEEDGWTSWESRFILQYLKLAPGTSVEALKEKLKDFIETYAPEAFHGNLQIKLNPLRSLYLDDFDGVGRRVVRLLSVMAILLLVIAAINFMNLTTTQSLGRAHEVGIRKALGARPFQLVWQYLGESIFICGMSVILSFGIAWLFRDVPFLLTDKELVLPRRWDEFTFAVAFGIMLVTGIGAGLYPAFILSSFEPVKALKGTISRNSVAEWLRRTLVVVQFAAAVVMVIAVGTIYRQLSFIDRQDMGFNRENVLVINSVPREFNTNGLERMRTVGAHMEKVPGVVSASLSWRTADEQGDSRAVHAPGTPRETALSVHTAIVDVAFADTYGLRIKEGRFFSAAHPADSAGVVLNERAVRLLGWGGEPIDGKELIVWNGARPDVEAQPPPPRPVIGVVEDYHFISLHQPIGPLAILSINLEQIYRVMSLRLATDNLQETVRQVENAWRDALPGAAFEFTFIDDQIDRAYRTEEQIGQFVGIAAVLAILIAYMGMLGLASLNVVRRTREIGIRKVLGATVRQIVLLLWRDFIKPVIVAIVLALPVAYLLMRHWLDDFAYRIDLGMGLFLLSAIMAVVVAVLAVSYHAIRAANTDPVQTLRYE